MKNKTLNPYQVRENDMVLAESKPDAIELMMNEFGIDALDPDIEVDVELVPMSTELHHEDGTVSTTVGEYIKDMTEPQYLVGWE